MSALCPTEVDRVLTTYFRGYAEDVMYWAPLLAYAFMRNDAFVSVQQYGNTAMPLCHGTTHWEAYPFNDFLNDGLTVVRAHVYLFFATVSRSS